MYSGAQYADRNPLREDSEGPSQEYQESVWCDARKRNIILRPSKLMTVEAMVVIVKCVIIFHNMMVEERFADELVDEVENNTDVVVGVEFPRCGAVFSG